MERVYLLHQLIDTQLLKQLNNLWENEQYDELVNDIIKKENSLTTYCKTNYPDYVLMKYAYLIENTTIHTYHRDYTSCKEYNNLDHTSYSIIVYLYGENNGLTYYKNSSTSKLPLYILPGYCKTYECRPGDAVLFDANVVHAGLLSENPNQERKCIQFKLVHKDDVNKLPLLNENYVLINRPNYKSYKIRYLETVFTGVFPCILDFFEYNIKTSFYEKKTWIQKLISKLVYTDSQFYQPQRLNVQL
jgi:hypothetical protein